MTSNSSAPVVIDASSWIVVGLDGDGNAHFITGPFTECHLAERCAERLHEMSGINLAIHEMVPPERVFSDIHLSQINRSAHAH